MSKWLIWALLEAGFFFFFSGLALLLLIARLKKKIDKNEVYLNKQEEKYSINSCFEITQERRPKHDEKSIGIDAEITALKHQNHSLKVAIAKGASQKYEIIMIGELMNEQAISPYDKTHLHNMLYASDIRKTNLDSAVNSSARLINKTKQLDNNLISVVNIIT
ncbi:hypothetical protein [Marinomonas sp. IMCC 4694]|uniref:hypothetical protein n=1 Tax=Marinomonas sp. IMCC 4694 TaxID=2605432 RepID=UPI0011E72B42|nr:hypothetical protein [Marinomonas sp. IMCC 4694]TYL47812.1 hypothetical protein FXV75_07565 [Marinomonas sp. IMCC 4694]